VDEAVLLGAIRQAVARTQADRRQLARLMEVQSRIKTLTPREAGVFALVVTGMLNKQIGSALGIGEKTVKVHRARDVRCRLPTGSSPPSLLLRPR